MGEWALGSDVRIDQSTRLLDGLADRVGQWADGRERADRLGQYHTQLTVLRQVLTGALDRLRQELAGASATPDVGQTYALCRIADQRVELVRRIFEYYRSKFDQRDDPEAGPILRAADEVVWSCWAQPFRTAQADHPDLVRPPAPLPYMEPAYAPSAIPRDDPPPDLVPEADSALAAVLRTLPIPLVSLPPLCLTDPWWLVLIAHEVGHHLQFDLASDWKLVAAFADAVERASSSAAVADPGSWRSWSQEIFADACSVYFVGPAAIRAIVHLELDTQGRMLRSVRAKYPPPLVRLAVLAGFADGVDVAGTAALAPVLIEAGGLPVAEAEYLTGQLAIVSKVVAAVTTEGFADLGNLSRLTDWSPAPFRPGGAVGVLRDGLLGRAPLLVKRSVVTPRRVVAASVGAWDAVASIADPGEREAARVTLMQAVPPAIVAGRDEATRAAERTAVSDVGVLVEQVSSLLAEHIPWVEER